jgi:hypothetical protein
MKCNTCRFCEWVDSDYHGDKWYENHKCKNEESRYDGKIFKKYTKGDELDERENFWCDKYKDEEKIESYNDEELLDMIYSIANGFFNMYIGVDDSDGVWGMDVPRFLIKEIEDRTNHIEQLACDMEERLNEISDSLLKEIREER